MKIKSQIVANMYRDSIALMRLARDLFEREDVARAEVLMATPANLEVLGRAGLLADEIGDASPNDIIIAIEAESDKAADSSIEWAKEMLTTPRAGASAGEGTSIFSLQSALEAMPDVNLALLSIPGPFVKREALRALENGLNLLIFSDNVSVQDEIEIKSLAEAKGLLVMGPDCGTAIIQGVALGFANVVHRGRVGIVGASGTGIQEVSCLIDRAGAGVSHAIGTGSNDVKDEIGATTLLRGMRMLESDPNTAVIVIITKPPGDAVQRAILNVVREVEKPTVVNFLGGNAKAIEAAGALPAYTLEDAARLATEKAGSKYALGELNESQLRAEWSKLGADQKYVRGVFSGGTFASEAALVLSEILDPVFTNTGLRQAQTLEDAQKSQAHACVDLGEDEFTQGKPHPMLDPSMRHERILQEARDPEVAVLLLDVVLGQGVHPDPAGSLVDTLVTARRESGNTDSSLPMVASVCGTDSDPQVRSEQVTKLEEAGVVVVSSNSQAARAAAFISQRGMG